MLETCFLDVKTIKELGKSECNVHENYGVSTEEMSKNVAR